MGLTLVVYCHPYTGSFNHAELVEIVNQLARMKAEYQIIDLYAEKFNPAYDQEELELFHTGQTHDRQVTKYLQLMRSASRLIIVTPVWLNDIPGMLKGFIDKVMKEGPGLSHTVSKTGIKGLLTNISSVMVFTTSTSPTFYLRLFCGNAIKRVFIRGTLKQLGMKHIHWHNFGTITSSKLVQRRKYLEHIKKIIKAMPIA